MSDSDLVANESTKVHLKYFREADRLNSFVNWPFEYVSGCSREKLAEAGFYYDGTPAELDRVCCFLCYKTLGDWGANDCPWTEHSKHSPKCFFVTLNTPEAFHSGKNKSIIKKLLEINYQRYSMGNCTFPIVHSDEFMSKIIGGQQNVVSETVEAEQSIQSSNQSQYNQQGKYGDNEEASDSGSICSHNDTPDLEFNEPIDIYDDSDDSDVVETTIDTGVGKVVTLSERGELSYLKTSFGSLNKSFLLLNSKLREHIHTCTAQTEIINLKAAKHESTINKHVASFRNFVGSSTNLFEAKLKSMDELLFRNNEQVSDMFKICTLIISENRELKSTMAYHSINLQLVRENERLKSELDQLREENVSLRFERLSSGHKTFDADKYFDELDTSELIPEVTIGGLNVPIQSMERQLRLLVDGQDAIKKQLNDLTRKYNGIHPTEDASIIVNPKKMKGKMSTKHNNHTNDVDWFRKVISNSKGYCEFCLDDF